jgi:ubiquinone/menaquinone biosynthesis C-methylase UbiE
MDGQSPVANLQTYGRRDVAAHYAALDYLTPCERLLFETYIPQGSAILDLGVGGGRTTPYLASRASRYVGVDYAVSMVEVCRTKFPDLEFVVADAADLSVFKDSSFDAVVFAFNGIDYVLPDDRRRSCLRHIHRVLKPGGCAIFSSHNPRSVIIRPSWNRERLQSMAEQYSAKSKVLYWLLHTALTLARFTVACGQASIASLRRAVRRLPAQMFWRGEGTLVDSAHGGLLTHYSTPERVIAEVAGFHLHPAHVLGDDYPRSSHPYLTDWYYYVFTKPEK